MVFALNKKAAPARRPGRRHGNARSRQARFQHGAPHRRHLSGVGLLGGSGERAVGVFAPTQEGHKSGSDKERREENTVAWGLLLKVFSPIDSGVAGRFRTGSETGQLVRARVRGRVHHPTGDCEMRIQIYNCMSEIFNRVWGPGRAAASTSQDAAQVRP